MIPNGDVIDFETNNAANVTSISKMLVVTVADGTTDVKASKGLVVIKNADAKSLSTDDIAALLADLDGKDDGGALIFENKDSASTIYIAVDDGKDTAIVKATAFSC